MSDRREYQRKWYAENARWVNAKRRQRTFDEGYTIYPSGRRMPEIDKGEYAAWVKERRIASGRSIKQCARLTGVSEVSWRSYENANTRPCENNYLRIERLLGKYAERIRRTEDSDKVL